VRVPQTDAEAQQGRQYVKSWEAIGELLSRGHSWSGYERNCCYLNTRDGRFANVSSVAGLDLLADSRAVAIVDWDHDGDLDTWISNRTGPRIQFLRNETTGHANSIAIHLTGTKCNRDAIGARLELTTESRRDRPLVRYVTAGDGYLSQSSHWVHFGLGEDTRIERLTIRWPGDEPEVIVGLEANRRYRIVQGRGMAELWTPPTQPTLPVAAIEPREPASSIRIVPHRRLPIPDIPYVARDGKEVDRLEPQSRWTLIIVWASWCQPCLDELAEFSAKQATLAELDCTVVPLNVDDFELPLAERIAIAEKVHRQFHPPTGGLATVVGAERLDSLQRILVSKQESLPVPSSFLVDEFGRLAAVYKGRLRFQQLESDLRQPAPAEDNQPPNEAIPFAGRWYVNPLPADTLAIPAKLLDISHTVAAHEYLGRHVYGPAARISPGEDVPLYLKNGQAAEVSMRAGVLLAKERQFREAEESLLFTLRLAPNHWEAHAALAEIYAGQHRDADVLVHSRQMLRLKPNDVMTANNVAWILATSPVDAVRSSTEAVQIARYVCERTGRKLPQTLDTLAAAYASDNQFEAAIATAQEALALARDKQQADTAERIENRLRLYQQRQPYRSR
jgi:tetratricopeptide (TPR) repeat protein